MASLFVIRGQDQGRRFELDHPVILLGRDHQSDFQLHDTEVSRQHAELRRDETGDYFLVDLASSNGCYLNSQEVQREKLKNGDRLQMGRTLLIFTSAVDDSSAVPLDVDIVARVPSESRIVRTHRQQDTLVGSDANPRQTGIRSDLQVMYRTALAVSHTLDIDQLLERIMGLIFEWVEADRGCIMLADSESEELMPAVRRNRQQATESDPIKISRTILDYVRDNNEGVLTSDARDDERWDPAGSIVTMGVREAICVPMQGRYGVVGVIYIDTYTEPGERLPQRSADKFSDDHLKLMVAIGHQAALAVEDTSYYSAMVQSERLAAMGQTIATLSHHIKNILQGIQGGSYLIEEGLKTEATALIRKGWGMVEKNQEKISNLVMDMLSFSKEREPQLAPADMNRVVADVVELMGVRAEEAGVALKCHPAENLPPLLFDADGMHRAVLNVVTNAIDACHDIDQGAVQLRVECASAELRIVVEDNGPGIPEEDLEKIFSVFESRKGNRGTGLGLPVSQKILREHQGEVVVESKLGGGSRFILSLPARMDDPNPHGDTLVEPL